MKTTVIIAALAGLAPALVDASVSTYSQLVCMTHQSTKKLSNIPTTTLALTLSLTQKVTIISTPTSTVTPPLSTSIVVATSTYSTTTTLPQVTDTATVTSTSTQTDIVYTTAISTMFVTSTVSTTSSSTTTVPTSAGFTPLSAELASSGYTVGIVGSMKRRSLQKRRAVAAAEEDAAELLVRAAKISPTPLWIKGGPMKYPAAVTCEGLVEIVSTSTTTLTAKTTKTLTTSAATTTITSTTTMTTTITDIPVDASTTTTVSASATVSSTSTIFSSTTSTLTSTSTVFAPVATIYAACASDNLVNTINGLYLANGYPRAGHSQTTASSAYDCCVDCLLSSTCGAAAFDTPSGTCFIVNEFNTCSASQQVCDIGTGSETGTQTGLQLTFANSNCGQAYYSGTYIDD